MSPNSSWKNISLFSSSTTVIDSVVNLQVESFIIGLSLSATLLVIHKERGLAHHVVSRSRAYISVENYSNDRVGISAK